MAESSDVTVTTDERMVLATIKCAQMDDQLGEALKTAVLAAAQQAKGLPIVLDMSGVSTMPSLCIGMLVTLWKQFGQAKKGLILVGLQPKVRETLTVCRLDKLFEICEGMDEARARLSK